MSSTSFLSQGLPLHGALCPEVLTLQAIGAPSMAEEIAAGLDRRPRMLPCKYLYDAKGSQLYEAITRLPEYYPTRTEAALLETIADDLLARQGAGSLEVVELGCGSATKTRTLFEAARRHAIPLRYVPIDVSPSMLSETVGKLLREYPEMAIRGLAGEYEQALVELCAAARRLVLFLGGTVGNLDPEEQAAFFAHLEAALAPGHQLLLGFDRRPHARKPRALIEAAYDDAAGVTARFDLNLLERLDRELEANFDLSAFYHRAYYDEADHQIVMELVSQRAQRVHVGALGRSFEFAEGEALRTEISRKHDPQEFISWFEARGWTCAASYGDPQELYGLLLLRREA